MSEGNGFSNKEILIRLEEKVDKVLDDHENRLRVLERFKNAVPSLAALGALSGIAAVAVAFIK